MAKGNKRTQKDEDDYNLVLRREEPIKTEIIVKLRDENHLLWESQVRLLDALNAANRALLVYREQQQTFAEARSKQSFHATMVIQGYRWDDVDGWHRTNEEKA
jgi:hypothetical protein